MGVVSNIKRSFLEPKLEPKYKENLEPASEDGLVNNKFDYSNSVPTVLAMIHLVKYLYNNYEQYLWLVTEDEKEYEKTHKYYNYEKTYRLIFDVRIRERNYSIITCKSTSEFEKAVEDGKLDNIDSMEIRLILDYRKPNTPDYIMYNNFFVIQLKPFDITFLRKSNYNQLDMNAIENNVNEILRRFTTINSIFCTK